MRPSNGGIHIRNSATHQFAADIVQPADLIQSGGHVPGIGAAHGLDGAWGVSTDFYIAYSYLFGHFSHNRGIVAS